MELLGKKKKKEYKTKQASTTEGLRKATISLTLDGCICSYSYPPPNRQRIQRVKRLQKAKRYTAAATDQQNNRTSKAAKTTKVRKFSAVEGKLSREPVFP